MESGGPSYCPTCGARLEGQVNYCPSCGAPVVGQPPGGQAYPGTGYPPPQSPYMVPAKKDTGVALILGILPGIFGIWGIGQMYVGRVIRGVALLVLGLVGIGGLWILLIGGYMIGMMNVGADPAHIFPGALILIIILVAVTIALLIWQAYDAYALAKSYNEHIDRYGTAPW
ncbi:MAG: zinc-ribbon domain-containing protein [Methanomassiliicoccales archaeon]